MSHVRPRALHLHAGNLYGGVETFLLALARICEAASIQPVFGLCFEGRLEKELRRYGADVKLLGAARFSRPWTVRGARQHLGRLLADERFETVVCHNAWPHALFAPVARKHGVPLVYWAHNPPAGDWLDWCASRTKPDSVIANSQFTLSQHIQLFADAPKAVARYPVSRPSVVPSSSARHEIRRSVETGDEDVVIVCTSRLERWKGHHLLLDALALIADQPHWTTWIAGAPQRAFETAYYDELRDKANSGSLRDRVRFIGQRDDIYQVLYAADVHCQPNTGPEPFGIAFIEALWSGIPVVTTAMGGACEIVTPQCGRLVGPDADDLAATLKELVQNQDLRQTLGRAAPARAAELCDPAAALAVIDERLNAAAGRRQKELQQ